MISRLYNVSTSPQGCCTRFPKFQRWRKCSDLLHNSSDITIKYTQLQVKLIYQQKVLLVFDMQQSECCVIRIRVIKNDLSIQKHNYSSCQSLQLFFTLRGSFIRWCVKLDLVFHIKSRSAVFLVAVRSSRVKSAKCFTLSAGCTSVEEMCHCDLCALNPPCQADQPAAWLARHESVCPLQPTRQLLFAAQCYVFTL